MTHCTKTRTDIYSRVTHQIITHLEQGVSPWHKPWNAQHAAGRITRPLRSSGQPYQGINVLLLWCEAVDKGYTTPTWITYRQAATLGGQVRKGEHGSLVVYADRIRKTETDSEGLESEREIPFLKGYTVFNIQQVEGLPAHFYNPVEPLKPAERLDQAESFFAATGATIRYGGNRAYYSPAHDFIQMPPRESFIDPQSHAATVLHELCHLTGHPTRLNREFGKRFGDQAYSMDELVAELGSAYLCADLGITPEVREDHAAYLAHWLNVLKADNRAIFTAASQAQRAADFLHVMALSR